MRIDAEHQGTVVIKIGPRITKVGSVLRVTRLDELPTGAF